MAAQSTIDRATAAAWVQKNVPNLQSESLRRNFANFYARTARKRLDWVSGPEDLASFYLAWEQGIKP